MPETKARIIESAKKLFFSDGIASIRLQQIADASGISVGNLAYHYKNKEAIVKAVYENLFSELGAILSQYIVYRQLSGFDKQFSALYTFYANNPFTSNNSWEIERNYPEIQVEWHTLNNKILLQLKKRIDHNAGNGLFKPEPIKGSHDLLAQGLLLAINCWIPQQTLRGKPVREELYKRALWNLLLPHLTEKGVMEFHESILPMLY
jgi:AcrR family transcriptional regulator